MIRVLVAIMLLVLTACPGESKDQGNLICTYAGTEVGDCDIEARCRSYFDLGGKYRLCRDDDVTCTFTSTLAKK